MAAESSESLIPALPAERRPAIWPWLVMPLVTLALFYALDQLHRGRGQSSVAGADPETTASTPAEAATP